MSNLVIYEGHLENYGINTPEAIDKYFSLHQSSFGFYCPETIEQINEDVYYNHDKVRTINIPIEEMAENLSKSDFLKPYDELKQIVRYLNNGEELCKQLDKEEEINPHKYPRIPVEPKKKKKR